MGIPGYSEVENRNIQLAHQQLLQVARGKNNSDEVMHVLFGGQPIEILGTQYNVNPNDNPQAVFALNSSKARTLTVIHNHPGGSTFSMNDLAFFMTTPAVRTLTIATNTGRVMYVTKTDDFDFISARQSIAQFDRNDINFVEKAIKKMYNDGIKYKLR